MSTVRSRPGPPTPTQVHAQRFASRRLTAALVGRDPTLRRDAARTQTRALVVGAVLAVLALVAFAVVGLVRGDRDWRTAAIVRGDPSGALYVVVHGPDRLVPTPNLASARLLASAASSASSAASRSDPGSDLAPDPVAVRDDALAPVPRAAAAGIPDAPTMLPGPGVPLPVDWSVCDVARLDPSVADPAARPAHGLVVLGTAQPVGRALGPDEALLLRDPDGVGWLADGGRRARFDPAQQAVVRALNLTDARPRDVAAGFLAALPEGPPLVPPVLAGAGALPTNPAARALGVPVGSVISPDSRRFFLVLGGGVQEVPAVVAQIVRFAAVDPTADPGIAPVSPAVLDAIPRVAGVDLRAYPGGFPHVVDYAAAPTVCARPDPATGTAALTAAPEPPGPPVALPPGSGADGVWVAGAGAHVAPDGEASVLVDDRGRVHAVPDPAALGLGPPTPAARAVVDLLPRGPALDVDDARALR